MRKSTIHSSENLDQLECLGFASRYVITGTDRAGKTTLCYKLVGFLQSNGINAGIALEPSRTSRFLAQGYRGTLSQLDLFARTIANEAEAARACEVVICDRSVLDVLVYTDFTISNMGMHNDLLVRNAIESFVSDYVKTYSFFFFLDWTYETQKEKDYLRYSNPVNQGDIKKTLLERLASAGVSFSKLDDPNNALDTIADHILKEYKNC